MWNNGLEKSGESRTLPFMPRKGRVYVTQSISFPPRLLTSVKERAANLGLPLSAYVQKCLERDLETREAIVFDEKGVGFGSEPAEKAPHRRPPRATEQKT